MASIPLPVARLSSVHATRLDETKAARPWASLLFCLLVLALSLEPSLASWATLDRAAVEAGELWRLLTGHLTHWSLEHLGWDLLVFAALGFVLERGGDRRVFVQCTVLSALLISLAVWFLQPDLASYRGLSGIDCALVTLAATSLLRQALESGRHGFAVVVAGVLAAYVLKVGFELVSGQTVFVAIESCAFVPVPLAHVIGGAVGVLCALTTRADTGL